MTDKPAKKEKFEDYLRQVEETVKSLEGGKLGLEESIEKYETGIKALRQCYAALAADRPDPLLGAEPGKEQAEVHRTIHLDRMLQIERETVER